MVESFRRLNLAEAVVLHERLSAPRPGTLHPLYLETDVLRVSALQTAYLAYEAQGEYWLHSLHLSNIPGTRWLDASSPYGYGGPLSTCDDPCFLQAAWNAYVQWMGDSRVVVEYVRFHPLLANERYYGGEVRDNRSVVWIDLSEKDDFAEGYASRLQGVLKKAARGPLIYREVSLAPNAAAFGRYYRAAMQEIGADAFYFFDDTYFHRLARTGLATLGICTKQNGHLGEWLAACLLLDGCGLREYHLAATNAEGRCWGAPSFAVDQAARVAQRRGASAFFLGGGTDRSPDNALLFFKSAFSSNRLVYRTGYTVFDEGAYGELKQCFLDAWLMHPERPIFYRMV